MRKIKILIFAIIIVVVVMKFTTMGFDGGTRSLKTGTYMYVEDGANFSDFVINIDKEEGTALYYESILSGFRGVGEIVVEDRMLKMMDNDLGTVNYFRIEKDKLIFVEKNSSNFEGMELKDGTELIFYDNESAAMENRNTEVYENSNLIALDKLPKDYSLEQAKEDGCVVLEDSDVTVGEDIWNKFVAVSNSGKPTSVRIAYYYTLDPEHCSPEYYEAEKDNYPIMFVKDLVYDGQKYAICWFEEDKEIVKYYKYLIRCDDKPETADATFEHCIKYILVNDKTVTWDKIFKQLISSTYPADGYIDYCSVYDDYVWK